MAALATFLVLCLARNLAFWRYALLERGVITSATAASLWSHVAAPLALAVVIVLLATGAGAAFLRRSVVRRLEPIDLLTAFALGAGASAFAIFLLGMAGRLDGRHLGFVQAGLAALAATEAGLFLGWRPKPILLPGWVGVAQGVLAYAAWHTLILALAPPTEWDILAYHLPIPKLYLAWGEIREIPWLLHSHWPHLTEVFYALPLALGHDSVAALFHGACSWALVAATYFAARAELDERVAWLAAAVVATQPAFLRIAGTAHSDGAMALFLFLAGWALWRFDGERDRRWLLVGAALSGLGASCKLFGVAPVGAWALWLAYRRSARDAALYVAVSLAVVAPWYLKTWIDAGNPVWPFFSRWLGGAWGAGVIEGPYLTSTRWPWPPEWDLLVRYGPHYLLLPLVALAVLTRLRRPIPRFIAFSLIPAATLLPVVLRQQEAWRFLLPLFPALGMLLGWWALRAAERSRVHAFAAAVAAAAALAPAALARQNNELFAVSGVRSRMRPDRDPRELYLERSLDHYVPFALIRRDVPAGSRILLYREVRGYHLGVAYRWGDPLNQAVLPYSRMSGPQELRRGLGEQGITHVLINEQLAMYAPSHKYYDERVLRLMDETLRLFAAPPVRYGPISLYRLR